MWVPLARLRDRDPGGAMRRRRGERPQRAALSGAARDGGGGPRDSKLGSVQSWQRHTRQQHLRAKRPPCGLCRSRADSTEPRAQLVITRVREGCVWGLAALLQVTI